MRTTKISELEEVLDFPDWKVKFFVERKEEGVEGQVLYHVYALKR
jgi:hypothetical protein